MGRHHGHLHCSNVHTSCKRFTSLHGRIDELDALPKSHDHRINSACAWEQAELIQHVHGNKPNEGQIQPDY